MKLNLLPTYVAKEKSAKAAWVVAAVVALAGIGASVLMIKQSNDAYAEAKSNAEQYANDAALAVAISKQADVRMSQAREIIVNIDLAEAMMAHNKVYADLYDDVKRYVPSFFRITSISAAPSDANTCVVTMNGVIRSYQQYADLMLALLRIPDAASVSRNGYQVSDMYVPPLAREDQHGAAVKLGEPNIPDDPQQRLEYFQSRAQSPTYLGVGGFGSGEPGVREAMPGWQAITVSVVLTNRHIQTPDPRATLTASAAQGGSGGGGQPAGNVPAPSGNRPTPPPSGGDEPAPSMGGRNRGAGAGDE